MTNPDDVCRTIRLLALAGLVTSVFVFSGSELLASDESSPVAGLHGLGQQRVQAAHRKRRVIFNNDGNSIVYFLKDKEVSTESLLVDRTIGLLGNHVDSIFYCPWITSLGQFTHMSQIGESFYAKTGVSFWQTELRIFMTKSSIRCRLWSISARRTESRSLCRCG